MNARDQRYREVLRAARRIGAWEIDLPAGTLHWSPEACAILRTPPDDASPARGASDRFLTAALRTAFDAAIAAAVAGPERRFTIEGGLVDARGEPLWARFAGRADPDEQRVIGTIEDVTDEKRALDSLFDSEARDRAMANATFEGIAFTRDGIFLDVNDQFAAMMGYERAALIGQPVSIGVAPSSRDFVRQQIAAGIDGPYEHLALRRDGSEFPVEVRARSVRLPAGVLRVSAVRDITDRHTLEEGRLRALAAERANLAKSEFLSNMSHELRTPLNSVLGLAEALGEEIYGPVNPRQKASLATVLRSGKHLLALINDILDLSRIEAGRMTLSVELLELSEVCDYAAAFVRSKAHEAGVRIGVDVDRLMGPIPADRRRLAQVLINLLSNAVKFSPRRSVVRLDARLSDDGEEVRIAVRDQGPGIAEADLARLFQPFVQLDAGLDRRHEGSGLGLALVRSLVEQHHGRVEVDSSVGAGSTFTVVLPARSTGAELRAVAAEPQAVEAPVDPRDLRVLVVDDHAENVDMTVRFLEANQLSCLTARTGVEAVEIALRERPSVILMDVQLPVLDGLSAIRLIRSQPVGASLPIIAVTACAMPGDAERCLEAGADEYLAKPVPMRVLVDRIVTLSAPADR